MFAATILLRLGRLSRSKIWLHGVSPDGKPSGYSLPSPLKRAEIAVFRRLGYISPRIHSRAKRRWTRNLDLLRLAVSHPDGARAGGDASLVSQLTLELPGGDSQNHPESASASFPR